MRELIVKILWLAVLGILGTVLGWYIPVLLGNWVP